jgi:predicted nucleic acid-binding protein
VTNARRVPRPRSSAEALDAISNLVTFLHILPVPAHTMEALLGLIRRHPVTGGDIFDLQIIATMMANGIARIYTFSAEDLQGFFRA